MKRHMLVRNKPEEGPVISLWMENHEGTWSRLNALDPFQFKDKEENSPYKMVRPGLNYCWDRHLDINPF